MGATLVTLSSLADGKFVCLTVDGVCDETGKPRTERRLFKAGWNTTTKGEFLFDDVAAESVIAAFAAHGVPVAIDLEHLSLDQESQNYDPDARGYGRLEVRNGELWVCGIEWSADGTERITSKRQRYLSPVFPPPGKDGRIMRIHNIGLVAQPATDFAEPLAASANYRGNKMDPKTLIKLASMLADGMAPQEALTTLAIDMKTLQAVVKAMGGDPAGDLGALLASVQSFAKELSDMASGKAAEKAPEDPAPEAAPAMMSTTVDKAVKLMAEQSQDVVKLTAQLATLTAEKEERDSAERRELVGSLVVLGRETPATAWADQSATRPRGSLATMPLTELRQRVKDFGGSPKMSTERRAPQSSPVVQLNTHNISEFETARIKRACALSGANFDAAMVKYGAHKVQQVRGATDASKERFARGIDAGHVICNVDGQFGESELISLSNPVKPIEQFSGSSQRALEEFRLEYNTALAAAPVAWAEQVGTLLPSGSLRQTFPLAFDVVQYTERTGEHVPASTPQSQDITVDKREFRAAKQANLRRIKEGDFAYAMTWLQGSAAMARGRIGLRNRLVVKLLEDGTAGYWGGVTTEHPTGIDGQPFFSASHKVHPNNSKMKFLGGATWSNYQSAATPLSAANLTQEKANMLLVPTHEGIFVGGRASKIIVPLCLDESARLLLTVQDIILASNEQSSGTGKMGSVSNEHKNSGFGYQLAPELAGTTAAANYYEISEERIAMGLTPWIISEDSQEELLVWDESSEFYKNTNDIKIESKLYVNAVLLWPHAIRKICGA